MSRKLIVIMCVILVVVALAAAGCSLISNEFLGSAPTVFPIATGVAG